MIAGENVDSLLGLGLYTQAEAARYARISSPQKLSRWLFGAGPTPPAVEPQMPDRDKGDRIVTFRDFVQLLAIRAIRIEKKLSLQKIREALEEARDRYGMAHPFAQPHTTYLFGDEIHIVPPGRREDLVRITGRRGQYTLREVAEMYMQDLSFEGPAGLASRFRLLHRDDVDVVMDPAVQLGHPYLPSCGYSADTLIHAFETEGGIDPAADCFGVEPAEIRAALAMRDYLAGSRGA